LRKKILNNTFFTIILFLIAALIITFSWFPAVVSWILSNLITINSGSGTRVVGYNLPDLRVIYLLTSAGSFALLLMLAYFKKIQWGIKPIMNILLIAIILSHLAIIAIFMF